MDEIRKVAVLWKREKQVVRLELLLPWCCMYCGAKRGSPRECTEWVKMPSGKMEHFVVTFWDNPCGCVETHEAVVQWAKWEAQRKNPLLVSGEWMRSR